MNSKVFSLTVAYTLVFLIQAQADSVMTDDQLRLVGKTAFQHRKEVKGDAARILEMRKDLGHLSDPEKTRVLALYIFDRDSEDGRMRAGASAPVDWVLGDDPSFITDASELKKMLHDESDARRFYLLSGMAAHFSDTQKADFIPEYARMLFRNEPLARMQGEYVFNNLENASFYAYDAIVNNLKALNADFNPPEQELPYSEKIKILIKWLKANWPGCEDLIQGNTTSPQATMGDKASHRPGVRQEKRNLVDAQSSNGVPSGMSLWSILTVFVLLALALGALVHFKST